MTFKSRVKNLQNKVTQVYIALISKTTPWYAKVVASIVIIYALSPIDLIPDFIPVLGLLDDLIILPLLIYIVIKLIPVDIWDSYEEKAKLIWSEGKPKRWYYAIPFAIIWIILFTLFLYLILK
ncbi:hypothetical protein CI105_07365 [Candidatus Izimaplasma bacterium ZiA1]|uniref:YkvA family protein n=1 Tax=Candidatus Izimoplasma sp. ZiA1 TaxID=2024899 RepID=UPI000BAA86F8|nr:hypothetical protein CI105_07365 [Candidatus Izimaplasma bacterium ZiA1]